jgi:hypothetical protein
MSQNVAGKDPARGTYRCSASDDGCRRGGVGGAHGDEDEHEAHEQRPQREPVRARAHALDDAARRAPAIEVERPRKGGGRNRAPADLDGAAAGKRDDLAVPAGVGYRSDIGTLVTATVSRRSDIGTLVTTGRRRVGLEAAARRRRYLGVDATALTDGATRGQIGPVGAATCLIGALGGIAEVLDVCPPRAGPRM